MRKSRTCSSAYLAKPQRLPTSTHCTS